MKEPDQSGSFPGAADKRILAVGVHGMFMGRWWFQKLLENPFRWSFRLHTFDFPHHGEKYGAWSWLFVRFISLGRYVKALVKELEEIPERTVLIGHSIGAYAIQAALARLRKRPLGIVLICPTRQDAFRNSTFAFARRHPFWFIYLLFSFAMTAPIRTIALTRELLFSKDMPDEEVRRFREMMRGDSYWAAVQCLFGWGPDPCPAPEIPVLVIGAEDDMAVSREDVKMIAEFYGAQIQWFKMPHNIFLSPGWEEVADLISQWVQGLRNEPSEPGTDTII